MKDSQNKNISPKQYDQAAEFIYEEFTRRKLHKDRVEIEKRWTEVDRQVSMQPSSLKDKGRKSWHPDFELPFQANALEVLTTDTDQMLFPGNGQWFNAHAQMTDGYLEAFQADVRFLNGDNEQLDNFRADQAALNAINQAFLIHAHSQYNFQDKIKVSNAEAFKYGTRAVRVRGIKSTTFQNEFHGVLRSESILPVVCPVSIKDFYPDDLAVKALSHGMHLRPTEILHGKHRVQDLKLAAQKGNSDTQDNDNGGWLKNVVNELEVKKGETPLIDFLEAEGDLVIPVNGGKDIVARNMVVTVVFGKAVKQPKVIRIRENPLSFNSVFWSQYFQDCIGVYGTSPLMKGAPIQKIAQEMADDAVIAARMSADPIVNINKSDPFIRVHGKVDVSPGAQWDLLSPPEVVVIGNLQDAAAVFNQMSKQYEDTVGVSSPRLGAQTKSHQTAYAIETEELRGQSRTVGFARSQERGFLTNVLQAEAEILRKFATDQNIFVHQFSGYVVASGKAIAEDLTFSVQGSSSQNEQRQKEAKMQQTIQGLVQIEQMAVQSGAKPMNWQKVREHFMQLAFTGSDVMDFFLDDAPQPVGPPATQEEVQGPDVTGQVAVPPTQQPPEV